MSNLTIYRALIDAGMTAQGACAVIGNMMAESGMKPNIAQRSMTNLSDEDYTEAADNGLIDFAGDRVGYGLCQWTDSRRKAALLAFAKARSRSVGDEGIQVPYCVAELAENYPALWKELCSSHELYALTSDVCTLYERPAVNNVKARYDYAKQALDYFLALPSEDEPSKDEPPPDACPVGGCGSTDISVECELLAAYLRTEEFQKGLLAFIAKGGAL